MWVGVGGPLGGTGGGAWAALSRKQQDRVLAGSQVASVSQALLSPVPATGLDIPGSGVSPRILQPEWTRAARWRQAELGPDPQRASRPEP